MALRQTPPERGRKLNAGTFWRHWTIKRGQKEEAYATATAHWYECHTAHGRTQPCLKEVTNGALHCPRCHEPTETMGYVPLWRALDVRPMFVLVHFDQFEQVAKLRRGQPVWAWRDDHPTAGVTVVRRTDDTTKFLKLDTPALVGAIDLEPTLLKIWRLPALEAWSKNQEQAAPDPAPPAKSWTLSVPTPTTRVEGLATDAHRKGGSSTLNDLLDSIAARNKALGEEIETRKNGKHKKGAQ